MKKIISLFLAVIVMSLCAYAQQTTVTMYAPDGRTTEVFEYEVSSYKKVGWYENYIDVIAVLYAPDGRTSVVYKSEVDKYTSAGWYTSENTTMYAPDGRTTQCPIEEIQAYKNVGWFENLSDVVVTMYSIDGKVIKVYRSEVPAYEAVGWFEKNHAYYSNKPFFTDYGDDHVNGLYIGMTYGVFLAVHSAEVIKTTDISLDEFYEDYQFGVDIDGASLTFYSSMGNVNDIYSYELKYIEATDEKYVFGRGIRVGKSISYVKERIPLNYFDPTYNTWYVYDENGVSYDSIKSFIGRNISIYVMTEDYGQILMYYAHPLSDYVKRSIRINMSNGIITSIALL